MYGLLPRLRIRSAFCVKPVESLPTYSFESEARHEVCVSFVSKEWRESHHRGAD
jgi:hypothetical protein